MRKGIFILILVFFCGIGQSQTIIFGEFKNEKWENQNYTILDFWASWCEPCIKAFPNFSELEKQFTMEPVFLLINSYDDEVKASEILSKYNITSENIIDSSKDYSNWLGLDMLGSIIILNRDKTKLWSGGQEILNKENIDKLLSGQKIPAIPYGTEIFELQNKDFKFVLTPGLSHRARGLTMDNDYVKYSNLTLENILDNLGENTDSIKDMSEYTLYFDVELTIFNENEENNQIIISLLKKFFRFEKSGDEWVYSTDFLLTDTEF